MSGNQESKMGGILGAVIGIPIGLYTGASLLIPVGSALLIYKLFQKRAGDRTRVLPAVAIQGGHVLWMIVGAAITRQFAPVAVDIVVMGALLAWIWARPSAVPLWSLTVLQVAALLVNGAAFLAAEAGSVAHKALLVHVLLRVAAIVANVKALPPKEPKTESADLPRAA